MGYEKINRPMWRCECERPECRYVWWTDTLPWRCAKCKSRKWDRPYRLSPLPPITFNGVTLTRLGWAKKLGISKTSIRWRINQGWPMEQVLSKEDWRVQKL